MVIPGHVKNGVVALDIDAILPEGARVMVSELSLPEEEGSREKGSAELPFVPGKRGSIRLTAERIHELLDKDDITAMRQTR